MTSKLHELTLETLSQMDGGRVGEAFQQSLKRVLLDYEDRPHEAKPRIITLHIGVTPAIATGDEVCDEVRMKAMVTDSVPKRQTRPYSMRLKAGGKAAFNDESLDDIEQMSFGLEE